MYKEIFLGFFLGMLTTVLGTIVFALLLFSSFDLGMIFTKLSKGGVLTKLISLGTLFNLFLFHFFIQRERMYVSRGVLMAVIVLTLLFVIFKLI